jgi:hypothetical protein
MPHLHHRHLSVFTSIGFSMSIRYEHYQTITMPRAEHQVIDYHDSSVRAFSSLFALFETRADEVASYSWDMRLVGVRIGSYDRASLIRLAL